LHYELFVNIWYLYRPDQYISFARTTKYFILIRFFKCYNFDKVMKEGFIEKLTGGN